MAWGQWMVVEFSVEEELRIETQARTVLQSEDNMEVAKLCSALVKQNAYLSQLLRQATAHITELELKAALNELEEEDEETAKIAKSLFACCNSDPMHQDGTQGRSLFVTVLLISLAPILWVIDFAAYLLTLVIRTMNRVIHGLAS
jgi:hypothetical protein